MKPRAPAYSIKINVRVQENAHFTGSSVARTMRSRLQWSRQILRNKGAINFCVAENDFPLSKRYYVAERRAIFTGRKSSVLTFACTRAFFANSYAAPGA